MSVKKYLETSDFSPLEKYKKRKSDLKDCIPFTGSPRMHPYDNEKIVLIYHPFREDPLFFEFNLSDIKYVEDLPNIGTADGQNLKINRLWVQKGCLAVKYEAFEVNDEALEQYGDTMVDRKSI